MPQTLLQIGHTVGDEGHPIGVIEFWILPDGLNHVLLRLLQPCDGCIGLGRSVLEEAGHELRGRPVISYPGGTDDGSRAAQTQDFREGISRVPHRDRPAAVWQLVRIPRR